jgi:hypothetical protein
VGGLLICTFLICFRSEVLAIASVVLQLLGPRNQVRRLPGLITKGDSKCQTHGLP